MAQIDAALDAQTLYRRWNRRHRPQGVRGRHRESPTRSCTVSQSGLGDSAEMKLGYRYCGSGEAKVDGFKSGLSSHNVEAGLLFRF